MKADGLTDTITFMIDTGAAPNLIKKGTLTRNNEIDPIDTLLLKGITAGSIPTLGSITIKYMGFPIKLHVINDDFPIAQEGILGSAFLKDAGSIDFKNQILTWQGVPIPLSNNTLVTVPARTRGVLPLKILNPSPREGYIPRITIRDDVFLGDAVVSNRNGLAYVGIVNAGETECKLPIPTVELEEVEILTGDPSTSRQPELGGSPARDKGIQRARTPTLGTDVPAPRHKTKQPFVSQANTPERLGLPGEPRDTQHMLSSTAVDDATDTYKQRDTRRSRLLNLLRLDHLNEPEVKNVKELLNEFSDLFHLPDEQLQCTSATKHRITTTDNTPINTKQYRYPPIHKEEIDKQIQDLLKNKVIKPSNSPYNSPLWIVPKKADTQGNKRWRMVIDYRALNEKTVGDAYPLPNITEILDQLGSAKYFSIFDLASGFHQIAMHEDDAPKTAFSTPHGHYQFNRMPFGLKNAPATFQRLMDQVLTGLQGTELFVYLDDIVIYASSLEEHSAKFAKLAQRLRVANLHLQPDKCEFLRKEVSYLGHVIGENGVKPDPKKIIAVKDFPRPRNAKNIKQFLGLAGYYRRFIQNFSKIARPLTSLLKKDAKFTWNELQEHAFVSLRNSLCTEPILQYPDFTRPFVVTTDASGYAIGGIISQGQIGKDLPIAYASRLLNAAEQNYSTIEKELLAIVYCVQHFRPYLYGRKFNLVTDHRPLVWLHSVKDPSSRLVRWRLKLLEYEYEVTYKAGKVNANADALSRNPAEIRLFPLAPELDVSSSDESIFSPRPDQQRREENSRDQPPDAHDPDDHHDDHPDDSETDTDDSSTTDSASSPETEIFDQVNEPYVLRNENITEIKDNFLLRKDHKAVFVTQKGDPCDKGARLLQEHDLLPALRSQTLGRASVTTEKEPKIISLVIKERKITQLDIEILREAIQSLRDVCQELQLNSVSLCKGDLENVPSDTIRNLLQQTFEGDPTKILLCNNQIQVPPPGDRRRILEECHSSMIGGHKGVTKTYLRIKEKYQWPNLKEEIQEFIRNCRSCQLKKLVRVKTKQPMVITDTPKEAFEKISMDIMGPLPTTSSGNSYILTIQDLLTKHSTAIALRQASALDVADAFVNNFICLYGAPKAVLTDQGSHFINSLIKAVARKFKINQCKTTAYHPQSNGSIERSHHVLWEYLKQYTNTQHEWDEFLNLAMFSYNSSVHEGTSYRPHELVFGKSVRTPSSDPPIEDNLSETYKDYLTTLFNRLKTTQELARENLCGAKARSKRYYDRNLNPQNFRVGSCVYLLKEPSKGKLGDQYSGPYRVLEVLRNNNIRISISENQTKIVHSNKLRLDKAKGPPLRP
ncbi:uncharacterized protein LOC112589987 [Harpegnathos saltator]|uniref:uncharacterized protein LOC112589987 n=1 Tax=Harpegnathos saltator TaxID=610380 RepID=UPI000DBEE24A|nr:uncharacterized protein LOC112589987 [Harpegnathos saltator]